MSVTIPNLPDLQSRLEGGPTKLAAGMQLAMTNSCYRLNATARVLAPRRTGRLDASIEMNISGGGENWEGRVGTNLYYAPYQEYGTRAHGPVTAKYLHFGDVFTKWVRGVTAQRFMAKSLEATAPYIHDLFGEACEGALE